MQRCKAKSKRSGQQCKNYAIKEFGVCRMHGAYGGPKTGKGLSACKKAAFKHGLYSQETIEEMIHAKVNETGKVDRQKSYSRSLR